jgi:cytidine deaminase
MKRDNEMFLIKKAQDVMKMAYAPYSRFKVGAAILTKSGKVFTGCNVENASYGLTMCAERVALFSAIAGGEKDFYSIAIVSNSTKPTYPCGACRQTLFEFAPKIKIIMVYNKVMVKRILLSSLLPLAFRKL